MYVCVCVRASENQHTLPITGRQVSGFIHITEGRHPFIDAGGIQLSDVEPCISRVILH